MDSTKTKIVYAYAIDGKLIGKKILDYTDRSPVSGAWQLPAQTTETKPSNEKYNYDLYFKNGAWEYVEQTKTEEESADSEKSDTTTKSHETVDETTLTIMEAIADLAERTAKLEGSVKA